MRASFPRWVGFHQASSGHCLCVWRLSDHVVWCVFARLRVRGGAHRPLFPRRTDAPLAKPCACAWMYHARSTGARCLRCPPIHTLRVPPTPPHRTHASRAWGLVGRHAPLHCAVPHFHRLTALACVCSPQPCRWRAGSSRRARSTASFKMGASWPSSMRTVSASFVPRLAHFCLHTTPLHAHPVRTPAPMLSNALARHCRASWWHVAGARASVSDMLGSFLFAAWFVCGGEVRTKMCSSSV